MYAMYVTFNHLQLVLHQLTPAGFLGVKAEGERTELELFALEKNCRVIKKTT